ncbi:MAG: XRE family transcriptional regulator [Pseudomonadota bacterium]
MNLTRLMRARRAKGMSTRQLAAAAGVSAMAISKYERGITRPSPEVLVRLLAALEIDEAFLTEPVSVEFSDMEYRTLRELALPELQKERISADVASQLEVRLECEALVPALRPGELRVPRLPRRIGSLDEIEDVAERVRAHWGLGDHPIKNVMVLLEQHGFRVFTTDVDQGNRFDGFSAMYQDMPIIVLGAGWFGDRQRFTLCHELAHFLLKGRLAPGIDEERACHRFAGAFLVPKGPALQAMGAPRNELISTFELYMLKHAWGLSMQAFVYRALQLGVIQESQRGEQWRQVRGEQGYTQEPGDQYPAEQPYHWFAALARAVGQGVLAGELAAQLLRLDEEELGKKLTLVS